MKVLHVLTAPRAEGTPRLVLDWLHNSTSLSQEVLFLSRSSIDLLQDFERTGCTTWFIDPLPRGIRKISYIIGQVKKICLQSQPDVVIAWTTGMSQWIHIGARRASVKNLLTHAGNPPYGGFIQKYLYTYATFWIGSLLGAKTIVPSNYLLSSFRAIPFLLRKDFKVVYNCVDIRKFASRAGQFPRENVIMVATLENHKDHRTLLKAWSIINRKNIPAKLMIVGMGTRAAELRAFAADLKLLDIEFAGARTDVADLLAQSKVFVLSTTTAEGFGTVLIEALAAGTRIVATDVPACREVLQDGKFGLLVKRDSAESLAEAIVEMYRNGLEFTELDKHSYLSRFRPEQMISGYLQVV